jgi:Putative prokaryotic signal transducing protein
MSVATKLPPPPVSTAVEGGGNGWVELTWARNDIEAHLLTGRLKESGIETRRVKDRSAPGAWLYGGSNPWAPVAVLVRELQLEDARIVMAEISWAGPAAPARSRDPESGPSRAVAWWVAALVLGVIFTAIGLARTAELFESCGLPVVCQEGSP